jgi:phytoene dehydrogenase-like protein
MWDVIVIGAGVNGLVCAAYLAKAGRKTLVLESRPTLGGGAATSEIAPGFRVPTLAHSTGPLRRDVVDALQLGSSTDGLTFLPSPVDIAALDPNGGAVVLYHDAARTAAGLDARSSRDREAWPRFCASRAAIAGVVGSLFAITPPSVDEPSARDLWHLLKTLRRFRALSRDDEYRLLRWGPMPAADLVGEWFDQELLRAAIAADGIFGAMMGPWSAGSGMTLLLAAANDAVGALGTRFVRGGPGHLADALAAIVREAGGEVRTGARVARVVTHENRVRGVALGNGDDLGARLVVSAVDPKRTFLDLCDPVDLTPEFLWRMRHYRARGTLAKVNLALSALPSFTGVDREALTGRVRIGPSLDYLERAFDHAKYGRHSSEPWIELTIPSLLDSSLAPSGAHVLSAYVQFAPFALRGRTWDEERESLGQRVTRVLEQYAPGIGTLVVGREIVTPQDLERSWGLTGGHIFHGELALDQLLTMRPLLGWGQYRTPIDGLYACGSGTHPGTGMTGGSGANAAREILRSAS